VEIAAYQNLVTCHTSREALYPQGIMNPTFITTDQVLDLSRICSLIARSKTDRIYVVDQHRASGNRCRPRWTSRFPDPEGRESATPFPCWLSVHLYFCWESALGGWWLTWQRRDSNSRLSGWLPDSRVGFVPSRPLTLSGQHRVSPREGERLPGEHGLCPRFLRSNQAFATELSRSSRKDFHEPRHLHVVPLEPNPCEPPRSSRSPP